MRVLKDMGLENQLYPQMAFIQTRYRDPKKSLKDIEGFLREHPKSFKTDQFIKECLSHITLETAIEEWLSGIENEETRRKYSRAMQVMFFEKDGYEPLRGFIQTQSSIMELDKDYSSVGFYRAIQQLSISEHMKKVCRSAFSCFCNYIRTITWGTIDAEPTPKQQKERGHACKLFEKVNWNVFMASLEEPFNLIAEITFEVAFTYEYRLRLSDPRYNFLSLTTDQVDFNRRTITLTKDQSYHPSIAFMSVVLSEYLVDKLKRYIGNRSGTVFLSKQGKPLFPKQVQRAFEKASEKVSNKITPVMLAWAGVVRSKKERLEDTQFN